MEFRLLDLLASAGLLQGLVLREGAYHMQSDQCSPSLWRSKGLVHSLDLWESGHIVIAEDAITVVVRSHCTYYDAKILT